MNTNPTPSKIELIDIEGLERYAKSAAYEATTDDYASAESVHVLINAILNNLNELIAAHNALQQDYQDLWNVFVTHCEAEADKKVKGKI
ncbi:MAG TPA: hypothetical protein VJ836_00670 [Candidatus Saccharimonadales bacterium]|nr:hypothetical protein [Candidatus Saccharimonadales bacterium]